MLLRNKENERVLRFGEDRIRHRHEVFAAVSGGGNQGVPDGSTLQNGAAGGSGRIKARASVHMDKTLPQRLQKSVSGSFHKTALLQKRVRELIRGAAPLIETREQNPIKIAFLEMERGLIELIPEEEKPLL